jgi:hypothetical protein
MAATLKLMYEDRRIVFWLYPQLEMLVTIYIPDSIRLFVEQCIPKESS